ncbi:uncharacterized protein LOC125719345 isoform X2 [Brienomyrus brachyistius]|uniref:uncharacterized protein LOC125719345 isoform X2 n=1 Tax=Brienomyrus brachyistius TaxID=42636 RepID=UPI0020B24797|nr:uncharacterized protein LOC125719345 isoform X2 [Brienomyrus brachyistius]
MRAEILLQMFFSASVRTSMVFFRVSVPEEHHIILNCSIQPWSTTSHLVWTHGGDRIIAKSDGTVTSDIDRNKHSLLTNGSLLVSRLQSSDSGVYHCNKRAVANVEVLTGLVYNVSTGRTVFLPCKTSDKQKQKWMMKKDKNSKRKSVSLKFKNGTVLKEIDDPQNRFLQTNFELKIFNLQLADAGEYFCNNVKVASLMVTTETEDKDSEPNDGEISKSISAFTMVLIVLGMLVLLVVSAGLIVWIRVKNNKKGNLQENTELKSQEESDLGEQRNQKKRHFLENERDGQEVPHEEAPEIHYASLGHQNWRDRPFAQEKERYVIYSTVSGKVGN